MPKSASRSSRKAAARPEGTTKGPAPRPRGAIEPSGPHASALAPGSDLLTLSHLSRAAIEDLFSLTAEIKRDIRPFRHALDGKAIVMLFEKPSLRTRVSFEVGINKLGGTAIYMDHGKQRLGERESVKDYALNLERWVECIVARVYLQTVLEEMADASRVPVINALSDRFHPCQALADMFTLLEQFGTLRDRRIAFIGDGNNVCNSLMHAAAILGVGMVVVTPEGFEPSASVIDDCERLAAVSGSELVVTSDREKLHGCDAVYTDVWLSMGQGAGAADEAAKRRAKFEPYRVTPALMSLARKSARFMHCLPAHRGEEVVDEVIDSRVSIVYDQAENRMHAQNALLVRLLGDRR